MNIKERLTKLSMRNKIIIVVALILVVTGGYFTMSVRSDSRVTRAFGNMPVGSVDIVNDLGETVTLPVHIAETNEARQAGFRGVGTQIVEESAILYRYLRNTTVSHQTERVRSPLDMAFFNEEGELLNIVTTEANSSVRHSAGPRVQYRYILASGSGYMERNNISVDGGSRLLVDSLSR